MWLVGPKAHQLEWLGRPCLKSSSHSPLHRRWLGTSWFVLNMDMCTRFAFLQWLARCPVCPHSQHLILDISMLAYDDGGPLVRP